MWKDPWNGAERFIAILADTPRWGVDPDGVRRLEGVAMLDLDTGDWLTDVPGRMQVCEVRIPTVLDGGRLARFHLATGVVELEDAAGPIEAWDPVWRTPDGRAGGRVQDQVVLEPEVGPPVDVGGAGASRLRRGTAAIHAHWHAGVVVARDGVIASTREAVLPRLEGDLVAVGFSPNFDAPVVMTSTDVRFLGWTDLDGSTFGLELRATLV